MVNHACLLILDGWGVTDADNGNAVLHAATPNMDELCSGDTETRFYRELEASERHVGLPEGQMGNSETGHLSLGSGQVPKQAIVRIDEACESGSIGSNEAYAAAISRASRSGRSLHLLGLVSDGGVHSHVRHLYALVDAAHAAGLPRERVVVHCFMDGRDTDPRSGAGHLEDLGRRCGSKCVPGAIVGRYYAMDRDSRWERVQVAYDCLVAGVGEAIPEGNSASTNDASTNDASTNDASTNDASTNDASKTSTNDDDASKTSTNDDDASNAFSRAAEVVRARYAAGETDEFLKPIFATPGATISGGDSLVFFDFRADRMREITRVFGSLDGHGVDLGTHPVPSDLSLTCCTPYDETYPFAVMFADLEIRHCLAEWVDGKGLRHFHCAETEKYAHVTFFFNARREEPFPLETRELIASPKVATYDLQPEMSTAAISAAVSRAVRSRDFPLVVCNIACPDMVGHTGDFDAAKAACVATDDAVREIRDACRESGAVLFVTADHGNCEKMRNEGSGDPFTSHTLSRVPFCVEDAGFDSREGGGAQKGPVAAAREKGDCGALCDVAPSILAAMGIEAPEEMTGKSYVK